LAGDHAQAVATKSRLMSVAAVHMLRRFGFAFEDFYADYVSERANHEFGIKFVAWPRGKNKRLGSGEGKIRVGHFVGGAIGETNSNWLFSGGMDEFF
jgi:hypothetical protein